MKSYQQSYNSLVKALALDDLKNGFNGLEIRIWRGYPYLDTGRVIVLAKKSSKWSAEVITFDYSYDYEGHSIYKTSIKRNPICGWRKFVKCLISFNVFDLPDDSTIPHYQHSTDGDGVAIEYANKYKYRLYNYGSPNEHEVEIKEAKWIVQILKLIEYQFDFKGFVQIIVKSH
ncbi:MAG: hypothetical protein NVS1B13_26140 [Flavisolibacter sp.]